MSAGLQLVVGQSKLTMFIIIEELKANYFNNFKRNYERCIES
jgi:hypothetical protein